MRILVALTLALAAVVQGPPKPDAPSFKSGVELTNITATVSDVRGRFVAGLRSEDFVVYEDDEPQAVTQFIAGRIPVSLGIALDSSASMLGEKVQLAKRALDALLDDLFVPENEFFLYGFSDRAALLQDWTRDHDTVTRALNRIVLGGNTALYDTVAEAVPRLRAGRNTKKALVLISDGNDNRSQIGIHDASALIRQSEALVYAIGIDCAPKAKATPPRTRRHEAIPLPLPIRFPRCPDPVSAADLKELTDASGGRTELVGAPEELERATNGIADELSQQYYLGYSSTHKKDGQWHTIRVEIRNRPYEVRARRGYIAE